LTKISVVIPTRDRWDLATRAINSAAAQSLRPTEIIVVDDGSRESIPAVAAKAGGAMLKVVRYEPGVNAAHARNVGFRQASCELVAFLDSDDQWREDHLIGAATAFRDSRVLGVIGAYSAYYGDDATVDMRSTGQPGSGAFGMLEYLFIEGGLCRTSTMVIRREALDVVAFDETLAKHQDWDLGIRLADHGGLFYNDRCSAVVDCTAPSRISHNVNLEASFKFLDKHKKAMSHQVRNGFLVRVAKSAAMRGNGRAVRELTLRARRPFGWRIGMRLQGLRLIAAWPRFGRWLACGYLVLIRLRNFSRRATARISSRRWRRSMSRKGASRRQDRP